MKQKNLWMLAAGLGYGVLISLLSFLLIWNMGPLAKMLAGLLGVHKDTASHIARALDQFRNVSIDIPWIMPIWICGLGGWLLSLIPDRKCRIWIAAVLAVVLLLPLILAMVWFSNINGILVGDLAMSLLQWL